MKLSLCRHLTRHPLTGTWFRAVRPQFLNSVLEFSHTPTITSRFNAGTFQRSGFPILYFAENQVTALFEVQALLGSPLPGQSFVPNPGQSWLIANVSIELRRVVDLTNEHELSLIQTSVQELTGDWLGYSIRPAQIAVRPPYWTNVPTQRLGARLYAIPGLEGLITPSARVPTSKNLIVFPDKLQKGRSSLRFVDAAGNVYQVP